jgi:hypothetical protein
MPQTRAAVVIGANRTGGWVMTLESATAAPNAVAGWLSSLSSAPFTKRSSHFPTSRADPNLGSISCRSALLFDL